jgi:hypothetical protein
MVILKSKVNCRSKHEGVYMEVMQLNFSLWRPVIRQLISWRWKRGLFWNSYILQNSFYWYDLVL